MCARLVHGRGHGPTARVCSRVHDHEQAVLPNYLTRLYQLPLTLFIIHCLCDYFRWLKSCLSHCLAKR